MQNRTRRPAETEARPMHSVGGQSSGHVVRRRSSAVPRSVCSASSIAVASALFGCVVAALPLYGEAAADAVAACVSSAKRGLLEVPDDRSLRFRGKVAEDTARCRGGEEAVEWRGVPWVDWQQYHATGGPASREPGREARTKLGEHLLPNGRGIDGSLIDLEYQRIELIKFNLFDPSTYEEYVTGRDGRDGRTLDRWDAMRLPPDHPAFDNVGGAGEQLCRGDLVTHRTLDGVCNDLVNPSMGSSGMPFARNVEFDAAFPRLGATELTTNRHAGRIDLATPDPALISDRLFTREQTPGNGCNQGRGVAGTVDEADCDYLKAPFFNVLAAFWIQFMTHDWFSHTDEGHNAPRLAPVGCTTEAARARGCREGDRREEALVMADGAPPAFEHDGESHLTRPYRTTKNHVTAWWDASQIYGHDAVSASRVLRDPADPARLALPDGMLPVMEDCGDYGRDCAVRPQWRGQEATGFPDNWNIGLSFYHNLFAREHNAFVDAFRARQADEPDADSGLRHPDDPDRVIHYAEVDDERLFQVARLVVSAGIAKIHTVEWTPQLLYNEPLHRAMNSNWFGLFEHGEDEVSRVLRRVAGVERNWFAKISDTVSGALNLSDDAAKSNSLFSVFASGAGIFGLNNSRPEGAFFWQRDAWSLDELERDVNGGVNHFGSPFNFPEEFTSVYRLHALVPDLVEMRDVEAANRVVGKTPVLDTFRGGATGAMRQHGLDDWGLSMGRQRLGLLHLRNLPQFLQHLPMPHLGSPSGRLDVLALDVVRDRERGIPRFNEFRRQIGLTQLTSFDDFVDQRLAADDPWRHHQEETVRRMREVYGSHVCDASKIISTAQRGADGEFIDDCLGHPDGSVVDNIEDVDNVVGWLAEYPRPHGFAISETQFQIFIINASRRLFSDRFFTSSFRPEFYSTLGYRWVMDNGPLADCPFVPVELGDGTRRCQEPVPVNGHTVDVSPLKRVLIRNVPALRDELIPVRNAFDPWARDRGEYYSLDWRPRAGAETDPAFATDVAAK